MFTHYGLFWSAARVFWGRTGNGNRGQMLGRTKTRTGTRGRPTKRSPVKDYGSYVGVYCLHKGDRTIYVGQAGLGSKKTLMQRLKEHRGENANLWDSFSWFGCDNCHGSSGIKQDLLSLEAVLIAVINPGFNRNNGSFGGAEEVFQVAHEQAEGDIETQLRRIRGAIEKLDK